MRKLRTAMMVAVVVMVAAAVFLRFRKFTVAPFIGTIRSIDCIR